MAPTSILFLCIGNSCRSPMAEAMARSMGGGLIAAYSAGLAPSGRISSHTLSTLRRLGYPTAELRSKGIDEIPLESMDVVVSLLGEEGLAMVPGGIAARAEAWAIRDPFGDDEEVYESVARTIERNVRGLVDELLEAGSP